MTTTDETQAAYKAGFDKGRECDATWLLLVMAGE